MCVCVYLIPKLDIVIVWIHPYAAFIFAYNFYVRPASFDHFLLSKMHRFSL